MSNILAIDGRDFEYLGAQRGGARVYRGAEAYLRIGPKESIARDLSLHRAMEKAKFPVAPILDEGQLGPDGYFIEKSLGADSFRALFSKDILESGRVSDIHFSDFIGVVKKLYSAQIKQATDAWNIEEFAGGINQTRLMKELPDHADAISQRFTEACERLKKLPGVLTHGDCNPANIYVAGIIDLEDSFIGPLGYDVVSAIASVDWSPITREYEFFAHYNFTDEQRREYFKTFDRMHERAKLPALSRYADDLAFCRAVWLCGGMHAWPRIQQWRFDRFVKQYLS